MGYRKPESMPHLYLVPNAGRELFGRCACGEQRRFAIAPLARKYGNFTYYAYLTQLMVCQTCGQKGKIKLKLVHWDEPDPKRGDT